jgi:S1-C subfamily serine protease
MYGTLLDIALVVAVLVFAFSGYRQGFVVGALSFVGFFGGALLGVQVAPRIADRFDDDLARLAVAVTVAFGLAMVGQGLAVILGSRIRDRLRARPVRVVDGIGGSVISVLALLLVAWMVATPLASSSSPWLAREVRGSAVLGVVDRAVPDPVRTLYGSFGAVVRQGDFPEVFGRLTPTRVPDVAPPDSSLQRAAVVRNARGSVVKVFGSAPSCARRLEGSGFVYAPERVMTNAHVVAGVRGVKVEVDGDRHDARVVVYDPERDLAVLYVPELAAPVLRFAEPAPADADAVVLGYPEDGPYTATAARVRDTRTIRGPDIYQQGSVRRSVYTLRSDVRSGNSGGPLMSLAGGVYGVIFAAAADDPQTGFALTAREAAPVAAAGRSATTRVSTQACD